MVVRVLRQSADAHAYAVEAIEAEVRQGFALAPALDEAATTLATKIKATEAVCLHVRRGDMVHDAHTASVHGSCSLEYYRTACDLLAKKHPAAHFYVFSDDPRWCEAQDLTGGRPCTIVSRPGATEAVDLFLMRQCRHFITANSSSLIEIAAGAAETVDPHDAAALAETIVAVATDRGRQENLRQRGLIRAREFSWTRTAQQMLAIYAQAAGFAVPYAPPSARQEIDGTVAVEPISREAVS